ncbi:MAG: phosphoribosylformylglycinamidine synthase subunit PurQ [Candidatus Kapabacteria bacterium]|nr:phosphoribosylformylglycinamidine synthase subunit PurQ [Candidatus Kapabacteria bacterium]
MNIGVVTFPGSNCDADARHASAITGNTVHSLWHKDASLPTGLDVIILPGGFSYGDYLRTGAIARFSPIMNEVVRFANAGGLVFGICNGFQILCEAGLLPGALIRNRNLSFVCKDVFLRVENTDSPFTNVCTAGQVLRVPVAHGEGRYTASDEVIKGLEDAGQVLYRYVTPEGQQTDDANPNGSLNNIAGVTNTARNVMGLMPHPERACEALLGSVDGLTVFHSLARHCNAPVA